MNMNILKATTFKWYQLGALKWGVFLIGIGIGAHWSELFQKHVLAFFVIGLLLSLYVGYVWLKQR
jgi:hypothetical protein